MESHREFVFCFEQRCPRVVKETRKISRSKPPESFREITLRGVCRIADVVAKPEVSERRWRRRHCEHHLVERISQLPGSKFLITTHALVAAASVPPETPTNCGSLLDVRDFCKPWWPLALKNPRTNEPTNPTNPTNPRTHELDEPPNRTTFMLKSPRRFECE